MRPKLTLLAILVIATAIVIATSNIQQISAPRQCAGCGVFKKLTHEFEKAVIDAATNGDPNLIPGLLEQYSEDVRALDLTARG